MTAVILFLALFAATEAKAEALKAKVFQFERGSAGKKLTYLLAEGKEAIQFFSCGAQGDLAAIASLDAFAGKHCSPLLGEAAAQSKMTSVIKQGKILSLHLGGTENPETKIMTVLGNAKSWLAIFTLDSDSDSTMLFTGVGLETGAGIPRTTSARITFEKVRTGELHANYPLFSLQKF